MNCNVIIIHGSYGSPEKNWFPWLKRELEKSGCAVFVPEFPTPKNQSLGSWAKVFDSYRQYLDENSIIIGHSLGCVFILNILERLNVKIESSFLVSGFIAPLGNDYFDVINKTFMDKDKGFDWKKIRKNCRNFLIYHSDNDPYVPLQMGRELAEKLNSELRVIPGAGHFNERSGYKKFEILLNDIKQIIAKDL